MATRKEIAQNQKILYDDAVANNMFQAAVPSFKEFQKRLEGQGYQKMVFDNYKKHNVKGKGFNNLNEFRGAFGGSFYADENKIGVSGRAAAISASAQHTMNNAGRYNRLKQRKQKQQKDFGRVNLGTHQTPYGGDANNVVKDDFAYNPETGKAGAYVSSDNENVYSQPEAEQKQAVLDQQNNTYQEAVDTGEIPSVFDVRDKNGNYDLQENINKNGTYLTEEGARNQFDKKLADAYARKKEIEALIAEDHRQHGNPLLSYGASIGASNGRTAEQSDYSNKLATSLALVKQQIGALEAVKQYPTSSWGEDALKALDNTAFTAKTWDFGLTDFATMGQMERIKTKMDNNLPLSGSDKMLLKSKLGADAAAALEDEKMGNIYRWTKIAGQSLPFMADFFLTGGYGGITKGISRGALKFAAKRGMGKVSAAILKNTGIVAGDVIGSYAMAGTEQALKTGADIMQRHLGNLYQDEKGDYKFGTFDENGNLLHEGGESMGTALYKGLTSAMVENYTEKLFGHSYGIKKGAINFMEKHGMNASAEFFKNIGKNRFYTDLKKWMGKFGYNGYFEEVMEEEIGIPLHALLDGDNKFSDLLDTKQQLDIIGGMAISVGSMYAMGAGSRPVKGIYNRAQYYRFRNKVNVADSDAQNLMGDSWADIKDKIDNATNEQMGGVLADILRQRDTMSKDQINAAVNYGINLMKMRGYNIAKTAEMNAKEITNEPTTPEEQHQADIDNAYSEGHDADDADKHGIQIQQEDQMKTLAAALGISEQQLSAMSDEELESLTGQDDKLDQAIYDYQLSSARYQGVVDDAQDKVDLAAHQAEQRVDMYTDKSRDSVRNATVKASSGAEDYGVYIISGNIATNEDGSINVADSDDMILFYDPMTNSVEHADALRFAELGDEVPADDVKAQAVADAKEKAIKEVAGIVDGTIDVGSQFKVTGADGLEHTYEILADYGDGTAAISIDGNVVENPYSLEDLQQLKDLEDQKRLEAAKAEREQMEKERAEQTQETELPEETKPSLDFNQILNDNGNVVLVDVLDKDGNTKYPDSKLFLIRDTGAKAKVVEMKSDGTFVPHAVSKKNVATISSMSLDEYKQAMAETSMIEENSGAIEGDRGGIEVNDELPPVPDNVTINGDGTYSVDGAVQGGENATAPAEQTEQTPAMTLEDGTIVPMLEDGNPDFSKLTADQTAELYDSQFGEDADSVISGWVSDAKKALDKANNMTVKGKNFVEQKAAKEAKEKAIADAQAAYDSAIAIRDAYNSRQLAKVGDTAEGRKNLIEKARRKFSRLKSAVKDDAEAVSQLYKDVVGSLLHRLYDGTGIDVTDTIPLTAEEYVASNLGAHSLNYEGTETSKGVKQETGLSREDFAKTQLLAADGKGTTIDDLVHSLWENRPSNLDSLDTQDIRNALIGVLTSGFKASEAINYIENLRIAQAENILEEQKKAADNAAFAEENKAESEQQTETAPEVPEDATDENPLGAQREQTDLPFSARDNGKQQTTSERAADVEKNKVDDMKVVDNIVGEKTRKAFERLAKMMSANVQWQYSDKLGNGWIQETKDADGNVHRTIFITLDSSITEGAQFIFGHEMTHQIKNLNPAAYNELTQLVLDTYGSDAFDKAVDETMQRYSDAGFSGRARDYYAEEVVADAVGEMIRDLNLAHTLAMKMSHPLLATIHEILQKIKLAFFGTEYSDVTKNIIRSIEQAYVKTANGQVTNSETGEDVSFSLRQKPEPKKKGIGYKVFVLKDGKLYPPMVANPDGAETPVGVWLDADAAPIAGESKTGRPQVKQGGKGTQGGSGKLAYRPGWHLGVVPYAIQFNRKDADGNKTLFPKNFVFAEVEYAAPNPETDPWVITGAMKVNRILTRAEQADLVSKAGREPQQIQEGDIVTDDVVNSINQEIADAPKFSLKVYHGSGADFTEFDFDHMGEGAGSQAFGWGGYVTSSEEIGKSYVELTRKKPTYFYNGKELSEDYLRSILLNKVGRDNANILDDFLYNLEKYGVSEAKSILRKGDYAYFKDLLKGTRGSIRSGYQNKVDAAELLLAPRNIRVKKYKGNLYEVDIPDDNGSNYIEFYEDATPEFKEQIKSVLANGLPSELKKMPEYKEAERKFYEENGTDESFEKSLIDDALFELERRKSNGDAYNALSVAVGDKLASKILSSLGYTGIKYPAGTIMGGVEGDETNYVIFKPEDMKITEHTKFSIKTYHGSQASFDKFDHSFMGSGEGAQAYGWGTYVSEVEGIAKAYAKANAKKNAPSRLMYQGKPMTYKTPTIIYQVALDMDKFNISAKEAISKMIDANEKKLASVGDTPFAKMRAKQVQDELKVLKDLNPSDFKINEDYDTVAQDLVDTKSGLDLLEDELKDAKSYVDLYQSRLDEAKEELSKAKESGTGLGVDMYESDIEYYSKQVERYKQSIKTKESDIKDVKTKVAALQKKLDSMEKPRNLYSVDIPDDTGRNYIGWDEPLGAAKIMRLPKVFKANGWEYKKVGMYDTYKIDGNEHEVWLEPSLTTGKELYRDLTNALGSDKAASEFLSKAGFVGVKVIAQRNTGGNKEGKMNYVIFDENNAQITSHTKFSLRLKSAIDETETNPSDAQKESGNYKKGHIKFGGYDYTIENPKGSTRSGKDADGKEWKVTMHDTYGYIRGKFGKDGDHLDMFINDKADLDNWNGDVFVVDQVNPDGSFDEHKVMYGYDSMNDAKKAYLANYSDGWRGLGNITGASKDEFDKWLDTSNRKLKPFADYAKVKFSLKDEKIKSIAEKFGVNEDDVAMYANAVERGSTAEAARARANIKRYLLQANEDKISSFKDIIKYTKPINEALKENFGDLDAMIEERRKQVEAQRNAMEAARKRAQEEEEKRQKHLDELSLIPTDELDKRYMDAIANNDESTAREMLDESARRNGYGDVDSDYQGQGAWAAPSNPQYESDEARRADIENSPDVNLEDIALGYNLQPDDYFDNPRAYMNNTAYGLESAHVIKNALDAIKNGEKDVKVKVYRAVPTSVKEGKLRNGDWVTPSKKYAEMHGDNRLDGKYRIIEDEVPANQLWWDGNDVNEFGFDDGKEYRYKNAKNNRKLNDLITYDNKGNVIPPSKRFNSRKSDIRFSLRDMADGKESGAADMAEDLKSLNTPDEVDDAIKTAIDDMPIGWQMANKKMIHIAQALGENRKAEIAGEEPKFSLKDGTLIKAGTYFSGGGLVEEGLKGIIDPVVAVEYDEKISGVYRNNFGQHIVTADVRDVDPKELVKQIDGEVEYFHASPVCKNYSQAKSNHAEVELDKETAASTAEFINAVKPKVVTIENVKGYKDSEAMKTITDALDVNGYTWDADVYNAADYGGYTNRERLIVRAVRDGKLPEKPKKMAHKSGWYEAVEDIIPTMTEKKNGVAPWMDVRLKADGIDWRNIDKPLYVMGSAYADGKIPHAFADELLPTLRTKSGDVIVMPDGKVYRAMGRVLARVSGVSDDYKMPFSENLSHTIIGNGIPTQLTEHVIAPLLTGSDPKFSIRTYHGTGASFDKFDLSHALEGEGSESFGHGVYVTNSSKIGREYAQRAKNRKMEDLYKNMRYPDGVKGDVFKRRVFGEMVNDVATGGSVASAKEFAKKRIGADANDIQRTLENLKDREKGTEYEQNLKNRLAEYKEGLKWIDSLDEEYLTQGNANRYDVEIPDDNGSNYLDWEGTIPDSLDKQKVAEDAYKVVSDNQGFNDFKATPLNDFIAHTLKTYVNTTDVAGRVEKLKSDIKDVIENYVADDDVLALNEYLKDATPDDVLATIWYNDLVRDIKDADLGEELYRKLSTYVGDNAASQILSDNGLVGIKYPAGMIHGGAKEGDYNYVIFDENNANIVGNTRFSLRYDQFEHNLNQWKKDNNLPKDAQRPTIPQRNAGESAVDFLRRVDEYRKQMALWKTAPTYEQHLLSDDTALGEFNRELQRGSVLKRIAFQDSMLAIRKAQEAIMNEVGVDRLNMAEDAYTAENRSHGKGKNEFEEYNNEFLQPLRKAYHQMKKVLGNSYDNVRVYMMAKHGLERDAQMAFKKSLEADYEDVNQRSAAYKAYKNDLDRVSNDADLEFGRVDFTTWRQKDNALRGKYSPSYMDYRYDDNGIAYDYSGLSSLFDGSDFEEAAHKLVRDVETKHLAEVQALWNATNAATKKILRDGFKAGMMSKDTYEYVKGMYSHYIPLRGWDGTTADQVWDYIGGGKGAFNQTLKTAHGRTSIADDPIAYIENMAESGILLNNKNWVKQHLMLLAQNHPTSLLTLSKAWYVKSTDANGNEEWIPATPQITSQMNSNQVKAAIDAFEQKMEQLAQTGDATQQRDGLNIAYPQTHSEEREHEVRVMKDGEEYVIYVNGDPQLAQAMNNTRAHRVREIQSGKLDRAAAWLGRKMAAAYTSLSPLFIPSNYFRDLTMTLASTAIREDGRYNYLLRKNLATSWNLGFMLRDYQNGKLREKVSNGNATAKEQMFYDFMMNGGETGFVSSLDVEDLKKKFKNDLKDLDRWKANPVKVGHTIMDGIEFLNRAIEDSNRFAVYMTSIQYGRSIDEAVNDAKDVTLNFNRKGTGEYGWQMIRNLYLFINPAVQSLQTLGALTKHHPFKFTAVTAAWLASGVLVPIVNAALMSLLGGDDDKDKYWQFSKWDRRNNAIMWIPFTNEYVKIPLAQEFRAFYGIGDMIASKMMGGELAEETWSQYAEDLLGQVVDMLPLDPTGYDGNIAVSLMPNPIRPVFELAFNVDFTGKPLFKDTEYNKYDPNFTKAYVGTPDWLVRVSKMVNSIGNDYPDVQQNAIDAFGDPRYNLNNPAVVDHVLSSYLGGAYTMGSQVLGVLTKSLNDPKKIKVADIPLVSKFVSNPDDRPVSKKQGDEFWDKKEYYDRASNTISKLKKQAKIDGDYSLLERFYGSEEYRTYKLYEKDVKDYKEARKKERAEESGDEYRPHQLNAEDIYNNHATTMDEFEDMKLKQLFEKLNSFKTRYDAIVDNAPNESDSYYNTNKAAIDAIDEISLDKQEISELKNGFLEDGKDAYNAEDMKRIRELRKRILSVLEPANKVVVANQKAKSEKK